MAKASILDCTLRDGAYLIDKNFGDTVIHGIVDGLVQAKIDYIELGFFQNDGFDEGKTVFKNSSEAQKYVPEEKKGSLFTVLADCSRYDTENLDECTGKSIDAVRECFFKKEREQAINNCIAIKNKGYKLFVQPVDILGYTDTELIDLIEEVNVLEPYAFSIVDTFGSMYEEDLQHVYSIVEHNLIPSCIIGFHSHNNMQMSNALSQSFLRMSYGKREVIVDGTICGMGRGAGNTPTELVAQYMVTKMGYHYDMDAILDIIDGYMDNIRTRCSWGYSTPMFLCGCYSAHVNNVAYLTQKSSIRSRDIRYILNKIGAKERKRYPYNLIDQTYLEYLNANIDDTQAYKYLWELFNNRSVVVIAPGSSVTQYEKEIEQKIHDENAIVVSVNFFHQNIKSDFIFISNVKRYQFWQHDERFANGKKILTSNVVNASNINQGEYVVSFNKLVKCGWEHLDNATILLLRLLNELKVSKILLAGLDGYSNNGNNQGNYAMQYLELQNVKENQAALNQDIFEMLRDFNKNKNKSLEVEFITPSRFESAIKE